MNNINEKLLINLKIISKIKVNEKIYINNKQYVIIEKNNLLLSLFRTMYRENRYKNINQLNEIYENIFNYINNKLQSKYLFNTNTNNLEYEIYLELSDSLYNISINLENSLIGLENLKLTYNNDILIDSQIDDIINKINQYIKKINEKISSKYKQYSIIDN